MSKKLLLIIIVLAAIVIILGIGYIVFDSLPAVATIDAQATIVPSLLPAIIVTGTVEPSVEPTTENEIVNAPQDNSSGKFSDFLFDGTRESTFFVTK